jgi:uncharacterized membrane protein YfcA
MPQLLKMCLVICPLVFLAGFVDSVAGGGGLISLPAYLLVGLPAHTAAGTNKVVACIGTTFAAGKYIRSGNVKIKLALLAAAGALAGSYLGTRAAVHLDDGTLKLVILCALPLVAVFMALKKDFGRENSRPPKAWTKKQEAALCAAIGLVIGCYDGLVGPGTGTFLMLAFTAVLGFDLLKATGCAKVANLASNVASAIVWLINGSVLLPIVLPAAVFGAAGNLLGARYAIKGGSKKIRGMAFAVLGLMAVKLAYDLLTQ